MSDTVQRILEDMVPELEDFRKRKLFSEPEIKAIVKKRTNFEYILLRKPPKRVDFLRYIAYEMNLNQLRKKRKALKQSERKSLSDNSIARRIHFIFERAVRKFGNDTHLWKQFIDYALLMKSTKQLAKLFPRVLQLHPNNTYFWIRAAQWEFKNNNNVNAARVMFQRGIRLNNTSEDLWLSFFRMELQYVEKLLERQVTLGIWESGQKKRKVSEEEEEVKSTPEQDQIIQKQQAILEGILPQAIYDNATKTPELQSRLSFRTQFLSLIPSSTLQLRLNFRKLREHILASIRRDLNTEPESYVVRAQEQLNDSVVGIILEERENSLQQQAEQRNKKRKSASQAADQALDIPMDADIADIQVQASLLDLEGPSIAILEDGKANLNTQAMWEQYVTYLESRLTHWCHKYSLEEGTEQKEQALEGIDYFAIKLLTICEEAYNNETISDRTLKTWIMMLLKSGEVDRALAILRTRTADPHTTASSSSSSSSSSSEEAPAQDHASISILLAQVTSRLMMTASTPEEFRSYHKTVRKVLRAALSRCPSSEETHPEIWRLLLDHEMASIGHPLASDATESSSSQLQTVHRVFRECIQALSDSVDRMQGIKVLYLDWAALVLYPEPKQVRQVFDYVLNHNPPASLAILNKAIDIERSFVQTNTLTSFRPQPASSADLQRLPLRDLYEKGIREVPGASRRVDFWLSYVDMEHRYGDRERVEKLVWRAKKALDPADRVDLEAQLMDLWQA